MQQWTRDERKHESKNTFGKEWIQSVQEIRQTKCCPDWTSDSKDIRKSLSIFCSFSLPTKRIFKRSWSDAIKNSTKKGRYTYGGIQC